MSAKDDNVIAESGAPASYAKAQIKNEDFRGRDLTGADFRGAKLVNVDLTGARLSGADFSGARMSGVTIADTSVEGARFAGADIEKSRIEKASFVGCDFTKTAIRAVTFADVRDAGSAFKSASFTKCEFQSVRFEKSVFDEAALNRVSGGDAVFEAVSLVSSKAPASRWERARFSGCNLSSSDFLSAVFTESALVGCDLSGADFAGIVATNSSIADCDLSRTELIAAELKDTTLTGNTVTQANFRYVTGLSDEEMASIKEAGAKVSRYLMRKAARWMIGTNAGRFVLLATIASLAYLGWFYYNDPGMWSQQKLWTRIEEAMGEGRFEDAVTYHRALLAKLPVGSEQIPEAKVSLSRAFVRMGKGEEALGILGEVLGDESLLPQTRVAAIETAAQVALEQQDYKRLETLFTHLFEIVEDDPEGVAQSVTNILGNILDESAVDVVTRLSDRAIAEYSDDPAIQSRIILARVQSYHRLKREKLALADLLALETRPLTDEDMQNVILTIGRIYRLMGEEETAKNYFEKFSTLFPEAEQAVIEARFEEAQSMRATGNLEAAGEVFREIIATTLNDDIKIRATHSLALVHMDRENFDEAEKLFRQILDDTSFPQDVRSATRIDLAALLHRRGDAGAALRILNDFIESSPAAALRYPAVSLRMDIRASQGDIALAIEDATYLIENNRGFASKGEPEYRLAELYHRDGRTDEAFEIYKKLTQQDDLSEHIREPAFERAIELSFDNGRLDDAAALIERMAATAADDARRRMSSRVYAFEVHVRKGEVDAARKVLAEAMNDPVPSRPPGTFLRFTPIFHEQPDLRDAILEFQRNVHEKLAAAEDVDEYMRWMMRVNSGHLLTFAGETDRAEAIYVEALAESPVSEMQLQAAEALGRLYIDRQEYEKARKIYEGFDESILRTATGLTSKHRGLGDVARLDEQFDEAERQYEAAAKHCDGEGMCCPVYQGLVELYRTTENDSRLRTVYRHVLQEFPGCWVAEEARAALQRDL